MITVRACRRKMLRTANPMPLPAPVTQATLPSRLPIDLLQVDVP
jgi:hypothetical protein